MNGMKRCAATMLVVLLNACGGGGGGSGETISGFGPPGTSRGIIITDANAVAVAAATLVTTESVLGSTLGALEGPLAVVGISTMATTEQTFSYADFLIAQLERFDSVRAAGLNSGLTGISIPGINEDCSDGGQLEYEGSIADPAAQTLSAGDELLISFFGCRENGVRIDGAINIIVVSVSEDFDGVTAPADITLDILYDELVVRDSSDVMFADGDMTLAWSLDELDNLTLGMTGATLDTAFNDDATLLTGYDYEFVFNEGSGSYSVVLNGMLESTAIDGRLAFTTPPLMPFTGTDPDDPVSGELIMTSLDDSGLCVDSTARLTVVDAANLQIDIDLNGDDVFDQQVMTSWNEIDNVDFAQLERVFDCPEAAIVEPL